MGSGDNGTRWPRRLISAAAAIVLVPVTTRGQQPSRVRSVPSCPDCRVTAARIAVLAAPDSVEPIGRGNVAVDSAGRFIVPTAGRRQLLAFRAGGAFARAIGRPGSGPGEFREVLAAAAGPGDSLYVVDRTRRLSVFSPGLAFVRSAQLPWAPHQLIVSSPSVLVLEMPIQTPERAGYFVHVIAGDTIRRSLGPPNPTVDPRCRPCSFQHASPGSSPATVWISMANRYSIGLWDLDGRRRAELEIPDSPWFREWHESIGVPDGSRPINSTILRVAAGADGLIWVNGVRAPRDWQPHKVGQGLAIRRGRGGMVAGSREALDGLMDELEAREGEGVIEVVDLARRQVVTTSYFPGGLAMLNSRLAYRYVRAPEGDLRVEVFRLGLVRGTP